MSEKTSQRLGIGIDTGGTFTDSAVVDLGSGRVLSKSKAPTTRHDLKIGIEQSLDGLEAGLFSRVRLVSLSTTLATNSIVEGKGSRVGLILLAPNPATFAVPGDLPAECVSVVAGAHDNLGESTRDLDARAARKAVREMAGQVDSFAVSGYFSIYNAGHELAVKDMVGSTGGLPVVCGHELSGRVGLIERASTAALNARLLPLIRELLAAVKHILAKKAIRAPLMVVGGDGSLMAEEVARRRPVETILSGPAASVVGACRLTGLDSAMVVDMGGTTTDIAVVKDGFASTNPEGAWVGGWQTRVQAADIWTVGLGGDSKITFGESGGVRIGPRRAMPLCVAAALDDSLLDTLIDFSSGDGKRLDGLKLDFFTLVKRPPFALTKGERKLLAALDGRILHSSQVEDTVGPFIDVEGFVSKGLVAEVALTPTDLLHATGELSLWDGAASEAAVRFLCRQSGLRRRELFDFIFGEISHRLKLNLVTKALLDDETASRLGSAAYQGFLSYLLRLNGEAGVSAELSIRSPVVAVGAPAGAYLPRVAEELGASLIIPEHAEVANAVGAVTGRVIERAEAVIRPERPFGFAVITSERRCEADTLEEAVAVAGDYVRSSAMSRAAESGGTDIEVTIARDDRLAPLSVGWGDQLLVEIKLTATAIGKPNLKD